TWQDVVWFSLTIFHKLISNRFRKWDVNEPIAVDMPHLSFPKPKGCAAKTMRRFCNAIPGRDRIADRFLSTTHREINRTSGNDNMSIQL
ncbi:MAG TPA: hypothetical protein VGM98_17765, partial [Schlesneria sp.]